MRFRIKILSSSVRTDWRVFDVETRSRIDAVLQGAAMVCGEPFAPQDFEHKSLSRVWQMPMRFAVAHKRLESLEFKFLIECV